MADRGANRCRSGAAAVEFAIVAPVLVVILMGTIETCSMLFLKQTLTIAAYEAARITIVPNSTASDVQDAAETLLNTRKINGANLKIIPSNFEAASYGTFVRVEVTAPCNNNLSFIPFFYSGKSLTGTAEMMKEF